MGITGATGTVGGTDQLTVPAGSLLWCGTADQWSVITATSGDDGKFLKYTHSGVTIGWDTPTLQDITGKFILSGDISPAQITADQNDYNPTGLSSAAVIRLDSDAARTITGLAGGEDGRVIVLHNVGSYAITLSDEDTGSTAANRFALPGTADWSIEPGGSASLWYDATSSRWRPTGLTFGVLPVARGGTGSGATLSNNRVMVSSGGAIVEASALTDGQLLIGSTGAAPVAANLTAGTGITITNGAGSITIAATAGGSVSPFQTTSGVIEKIDTTDRLRLDIGEVGDIGLEIRGITGQTANFLDIKSLTTDTQPIVAISPQGRLQFGPGGTSATDTEIYRTGTAALQLSANTVVAGQAKSGGATTLAVTGAAHTNVTAEAPVLDCTGNSPTISADITNYRVNKFGQVTIAGSAATKTVTNAATVYIEGAPTAGANAAITNAYALWVDAGKTRVDGDLYVVGDGAESRIFQYRYWNQPVGAKYRVERARGTEASPAALQAGDQIFTAFYRVYDGSSFETAVVEDFSCPLAPAAGNIYGKWRLVTLNGPYAGGNIELTHEGNVTLGSYTASPSYGGGTGVIFFPNGTAPTSNPTGGGILYAESGAGKWRGSSGTVTTFGPAEPYCPRCGRDFALQWQSDRFGELAVCMWCVAKALEKAGIDAEQFVISRQGGGR